MQNSSGSLRDDVHLAPSTSPKTNHGDLVKSSTQTKVSKLIPIAKTSAEMSSKTIGNPVIQIIGNHEVGENDFTLKKIMGFADRFSMYREELKRLSEISVVGGGHLRIGGYEIKTGVANLKPNSANGIYEHGGYAVFDKRGAEYLSSQLKAYRIPTEAELLDLIGKFPGKELFEQSHVVISLLNLPKIGFRQDKFLKRLFTSSMNHSAYLRTSTDGKAVRIGQRTVESVNIGSRQACPVILLRNN